ncbi:MAG: c-type cytochrome [Pirellulales bacterium]
MMTQRFAASWWSLLAVFAAALTGCVQSESEPPKFRLDMTQVSANQLVPQHQQAVADILDAMFGTPDEPYVLPETGLDLRKLKMAAGPVWSDQAGGKHGLYRRNCAHCHGISGSGDGPTAIILNPYPRDYRPGVYKFKSTFNPNEPTDEDLYHTLMDGVPGTAMPAFSVLPPDEVAALLEYVKYLSMRGQMETLLVSFIVDNLDYDPVTGEAAPLDLVNDPDQRAEIMAILADDVVAKWQPEEEVVVVPDESAIPPNDRSAVELAESVTAGRELFYGTKANCVKCHGPTGLGDGQQEDYDNWSKAVKKFEDDTISLKDTIAADKQSLATLEGEEQETAKAELQAKYRELKERQEVAAGLLPPRNAIPRDLRNNMFRGGRRPLDLFRRIHQGIAGTPMPAGGPAAPGAQGTLTEQEMWQIVDYVRSLPFEPASQPQMRPLNSEAVVN